MSLSITDKEKGSSKSYADGISSKTTTAAIFNLLNICLRAGIAPTARFLYEKYRDRLDTSSSSSVRQETMSFLSALEALEEIERVAGPGAALNLDNSLTQKVLATRRKEAPQMTEKEVQNALRYRNGVGVSDLRYLSDSAVTASNGVSYQSSDS